MSESVPPDSQPAEQPISGPPVHPTAGGQALPVPAVPEARAPHTTGGYPPVGGYPPWAWQVPAGRPAARVSSRKRSRRPSEAVTGVYLVVLVLVAVGSFLIGRGSVESPAGTNSTSNDGTTTAATTGTQPKAAPRTVLNTKGSGIKNTPKFSTGDDWTVQYTYDCSKFASKGNFQVMVFTNDALDAVAVNELGKNGSDSSPIYGDPGTHYLSVNSECSWTVKVVTN